MIIIKYFYELMCFEQTFHLPLTTDVTKSTNWTILIQLKILGELYLKNMKSEEKASIEPPVKKQKTTEGTVKIHLM